jgi:hypothetical protein
LIAVGTVRFGGLTTVELAFVEECPAYSTADWDQIVHCSMALETGEIVLYSPELEFVDAPRMLIEPGNYQVLVFFANLDSVDDEMETVGDDRYRLVFWPGSLIAPHVIKQWVPSWA